MLIPEIWVAEIGATLESSDSEGVSDHYQNFREIFHPRREGAPSIPRREGAPSIPRSRESSHRHLHFR